MKSFTGLILKKIDMKNLRIFFTLLIVASLLGSCEKDTWSNGDPELENVYYFGFEDWKDFKNSVKFVVNQGETIEVPVQFHSEQVKNYDVVTYYYVAGAAVRGTDYEILNEVGTVLIPNGDGAFEMIWPKAIKGVKNIYVKALNGSLGEFTLWTFNPNAETPISNQDVSTTTNNLTSNYEVRAFSQNHRVTVTIQ